MISISMSIKLAIVLDIHHAIVTIVTIPKLFTTVFLLGYLSPIVPRSHGRGLMIRLMVSTAGYLLVILPGQGIKWGRICRMRG